MSRRKPHGSSLHSGGAKKSGNGPFLNMAKDISDSGMKPPTIDSIGGVLEQAPADSYEPPYSWDVTGTVGCAELKRMIAEVEVTLTTARFVPALQEVYQKWLAYAKSRLSGMNCKEDVPVEDGNPIVVNPPILPVEVEDEKPTVDTPMVTVITPPAATPYPVYGPGGGGGGSSAAPAQTSKKSRTWIWLAVAATAAAGYFLFKK